MIAVIDYDTGNLCSVENALKRVGGEYVLTGDAKKIVNAEKVILPGVGEASTAMDRLRESGLVETVMSLAQPVLGICIGLQLMCRKSEEGDTDCLGIFDTEVVKLNPGNGLKVPHMGWNTINELETQLFNNLKDKEYVYYVHSYAPSICSQTIAKTIYGQGFSAALNTGNFYGTQFHPEKSGEAGEKILKNFLAL